MPRAPRWSSEPPASPIPIRISLLTRRFIELRVVDWDVLLDLGELEDKLSHGTHQAIRVRYFNSVNVPVIVQVTLNESLSLWGFPLGVAPYEQPGLSVEVELVRASLRS